VGIPDDMTAAVIAAALIFKVLHLASIAIASPILRAAMSLTLSAAVGGEAAKDPAIAIPIAMRT